MTDISKKNSHTSDSLLRSDELSERLFSAPSTSHRTRHHRQLRARGLAPTPHPNEHLAQIPSTEPHQSPTRSARSSQKRQKKQCPEPDVSWKAYKADAIVRAKAESKSSNCRQNCTVQFRVLDWLKNRTSTDDRLLRLNFRSDKTNCEYDNLTNRSQFPVRAKIDQSKEYILFLNTYGPTTTPPSSFPSSPRTRPSRSSRESSVPISVSPPFFVRMPRPPALRSCRGWSGSGGGLEPRPAKFAGPRRLRP
jgi:hypothetical protein